MNLLIIGAGSFSTEVEELARLCGYNDIAFLDDNPDKAKAYPVIGAMKDIEKYRYQYDNAIVALGNNKNLSTTMPCLKNLVIISQFLFIQWLT